MYRPSQYARIKEFYTPKIVPDSSLLRSKEKFQDDDTVIRMNWQTVTGELVDPDLWGPAKWFSLHSGAYYYPERADAKTIELMKGYIHGLPVMLPCKSCSYHATMFIKEREKDLDTICSSNYNLFNFFVDFHNYVNKRKGKPLMSYEDARKLYSSKAVCSKLTYGLDCPAQQ